MSKYFARFDDGQLWVSCIVSLLSYYTLQCWSNDVVQLYTFTWMLCLCANNTNYFKAKPTHTHTIHVNSWWKHFSFPVLKCPEMLLLFHLLRSKMISTKFLHSNCMWNTEVKLKNHKTTLCIYFVAFARKENVNVFQVNS